MNDSADWLTASIWTADLAAAESIGGEIETGTVFMNRADYLDPMLAWTGVKDTGRGATLSEVGYEMLTRPKSFHLRHTLCGTQHPGPGKAAPAKQPGPPSSAISRSQDSSPLIRRLFRRCSLPSSQTPP